MLKSMWKTVLPAVTILLLFIVMRDHILLQSGVRTTRFLTGAEASSARPDVTDLDPETVTGRRECRNEFAWFYGYDVALERSALIVRVGIQLIPAQGIGRLELDRVKPAWEKGIERIWSNRFALVTGEGRRYPIRVDVSFQGPRFHHDVIVRPGTGRTDELNWNVLDSPELVSHEFGHMIGIYDEYERGALPLHDAVIDAAGIMTSNPGKNAVTRARHYEPIRQWFIGKTMMSNVRIIDENENHQ